MFVFCWRMICIFLPLALLKPLFWGLLACNCGDLLMPKGLSMYVLLRGSKFVVFNLRNSS